MLAAGQHRPLPCMRRLQRHQCDRNAVEDWAHTGRQSDPCNRSTTQVQVGSAQWPCTRALSACWCPLTGAPVRHTPYTSADAVCRKRCRCGSTVSGAACSTAAVAPAPADAATPPAPAAGGPRLQLYNSMSRAKEAFTPRRDQGNAVSMYVCGVTVYSMSHIGREQEDSVSSTAKFQASVAGKTLHRMQRVAVGCAYACRSCESVCGI